MVSMPGATTIEILRDQPLSTWFGVGGRAKRLAKPAGIDADSPRAMIDGAVAAVLAHEAAALSLDLPPDGPVELDGSLMA